MLPGYVLTVAKGGPKLKPADPDANGAGSQLDVRDTLMSGIADYGLHMTPSAGARLRMEFTKLPIAALAIVLISYAQAPVLDETGLSGRYQGGFEFEFSAADPTNSSLLEGVDQLGLRLEKRSLPVEMLVIDHIERAPSDN
jgi:uncharacterized protein (TIGR03435 family)